MDIFPHIPVLLNEVLSVFQEQFIKVFVDGTLGAGGHAEAILKAHPEIELYLGIDQDEDALEIAEKRLQPFGSKVILARGNFEDMRSLAESQGVGESCGILMDIGVSSMQLDRAERGFSFKKEGPLDMRMDRRASLTAEEILNTWDKNALKEMFFLFAEEPRGGYIAEVICRARQEKPFKTTMDLKTLLDPLFIKEKWAKKKDPLNRIFQALRIAVNHELSSLEKVLPDACNLLRRGGRMAVISFHSLEDRCVKKFIESQASDKESSFGIGGLFIDKTPILKKITRKVVTPTEEECKINPRAKPSRLRAAEKL